MNVLGMFAKYPEVGRVKTRLAEKLGAEGAASVYRAFLSDLTRRLCACADQRVLCYTPARDASRQYFAALGCRDFELWSQPEGDLGRRMISFFSDYLHTGNRVVLIGSDSPTVPVSVLDQAFSALNHVDCVLGPATDGGYYLIGLRALRGALFSGVEWGGAHVFSQTIERIRTSGLSLELLQPWYDVDTWDDLLFLDGHRRAMTYTETDGHTWEIDKWLDQWNLGTSSRFPGDTALPYWESDGN